MAKFTVYFKDKAIQSGIFDAGVVHIGRDETNELVVDSLLVAPIHAVAVVKDGSCVIKQLNDKFPLLVNNHPTKEWNLQNNDVINVGKHDIVYNLSESFLNTIDQASVASKSDNDVNALNEKLEDSIKIPDANLQIMDGPHIGRILPLKKAMTRLGHEGAGVVVIARRKDGYYVSTLQNNDALTVNQQPLGDKTLLLRNNDVLRIDNISMQFFQD